jgi:hypothetical protein
MKSGTMAVDDPRLSPIIPNDPARLWLPTIDLWQRSPRTIHQAIAPDILGRRLGDERSVWIVDPIGERGAGADIDPITAWKTSIEILDPSTDVQDLADPPTFRSVLSDHIISQSDIVQVHRRFPIVAGLSYY